MDEGMCLFHSLRFLNRRTDRRLRFSSQQLVEPHTHSSRSLLCVFQKGNKLRCLFAVCCPRASVTFDLTTWSFELNRDIRPATLDRGLNFLWEKVALLMLNLLSVMINHNESVVDGGLAAFVWNQWLSLSFYSRQRSEVWPGQIKT